MIYKNQLPLVLLASVVAAVAQAQTPAPPAGNTASVAAAPEALVVTATRSAADPLNVPASVSVVGGEELRAARLRVNLSEALPLVPGLVLLNRQNYAQDLQLSIRGFGARSSFGERGVRLYVDGIPATLADGSGQVSHFPIDAAERIEVLRGPFSALYGNSSGGVIALTSALPAQPPQFTASAAYGSYNTWHAGVNGAGGQEGNHFNLDASRFRTDGYREHSAARRDLLNLVTGFDNTGLGRLRVMINAVDMPDAQDPLGLRRAQMQADPRQVDPTALQFNTRKSTRQETLGASLQSPLAGTVELDSTLWIGNRGVTQYQAIPTPTQAAPTSPGGVIDFSRHFGGADLRLAADAAGWKTALGFDAERMNEARRGFNNFVGSTLGVEGVERRNDTNIVQSVGPYAQVEKALSESWRWLAGARLTRVGFESSNHLPLNRPGYGSLAYTGASPTTGLVFRPDARLSYYASYGRGFETPTLNELAYRPDGSAGLNTALQAATSNNLELGAKAVLAPGLRLDEAIFDTRTRNDLIVRTNSGGRTTYANAPATRRQGAELALDWRVAPDWELAASASAIRARFDSGFLTCAAAPCTVPNLPVAAGNRLPGVPASSGYVQVKHPMGRTELLVEARSQAALYVDDRNTDRAAGYGVVNLAVTQALQLRGSDLKVFARVDNVFDRGYAGSVIVNESNSRFFEPAPGRTWLVGLDWRL